jgi:hypothetical protein
MTSVTCRKQWSIPSTPLIIPIVPDDDNDNTITNISISRCNEKYPSIWRLRTHKLEKIELL